MGLNYTKGNEPVSMKGFDKLPVAAGHHGSFIYVLNDTGDLGFRLVIIDFSVFDDTVLSNFVSVKWCFYLFMK